MTVCGALVTLYAHGVISGHVATVGDRLVQMFYRP